MGGGEWGSEWGRVKKVKGDVGEREGGGGKER